MNYSEIKTIDIANGPGTRTSLFVSGCRRHCFNCFNPDTWSFSAGKAYTKETQSYILETLQPEYVHGLTILGGEPMEPENQETVCNLIKEVRQQFGDKKNIWIFSGFTYDELIDPNNPVHTQYTQDILSNIDVLVDGPYIDSSHNVALRFRGSTNQRIIDVPRTLKTGSILLWEDEEIFAAHEKEQTEHMMHLDKMSGN